MERLCGKRDWQTVASLLNTISKTRFLSTSGPTMTFVFKIGNKVWNLSILKLNTRFSHIIWLEIRCETLFGKGHHRPSLYLNLEILNLKILYISMEDIRHAEEK